MMTRSAKAALAGLCLSGVLAAGNALADRDDIRNLADARITLIQAIQAAEGNDGGKAFEASIDDDSFRPEYEVSIVRDNRIYDVQVDAVTGEVLGVREDKDD